MATATTNAVISEQKQGFFARVLESMMRGFENYAYIKSRSAQIEALNAKSDEELAQIGIKRDEIPQYVFRDYFYV